MKHRHIVSFSGGLGSWLTAQRVIQQVGVDCVTLLFTDTLIEDADLYRFLLEGAAHLLQMSTPKHLVASASSWMNNRRKLLTA